VDHQADHQAHQPEGKNKMKEKIRKFFNDILGQAWTLLGMFVAWVVLEGSAKTIVGYCIVGTLSLWIVTYPIRNKE
jgi:hypothetical protein